MKVGFTGTRYGMTEDQRLAFFQKLDELDDIDEITEFHHGDCKGADAQAHELVSSVSIETHVHPPKNPKWRAFCDGDVMYPEAENIERDHHIVDATNVLLACPNGMGEVLRSGTWLTYRYAMTKVAPGRAVWVVFPDGSVKDGGSLRVVFPGGSVKDGGSF